MGTARGSLDDVAVELHDTGADGKAIMNFSDHPKLLILSVDDTILKPSFTWAIRELGVKI